MHIVVFPSWYSTPNNPIRGSSFREFSLALRERGHHVGVFVPPSKLRTRYGLDEVRQNWRKPNTQIEIGFEHNLPVYRMPWWGWLPSLLPSKRGETALAIFDRYTQEYGVPNILHARSILYGGYIAAYIGQARNIPVVLTEGSSNYITRSLFPDQNRRVSQTLHHTQHILAVGAPLANALKSHYGKNLRVEVVSNSVDTSFFTPPDQPLPATPFTFLIIARLDKNKAVDNLIQAFAQVFSGQQTRLVIIGDGVERPNLEQLVNQLNLQSQIQFLGQQSRTSVRDCLRKSHALVSSSYVETFGNTLIEALACGKPLISTRSGGPDSIINASNGLLVPTGDVTALADALREMVDHYDDYDAEKIRAECVALYSPDAIMTRLEAIYDQVSANYARSAANTG